MRLYLGHSNYVCKIDIFTNESWNTQWTHTLKICVFVLLHQWEEFVGFKDVEVKPLTTDVPII